MSAKETEQVAKRHSHSSLADVRAKRLGALTGQERTDFDKSYEAERNRLQAEADQ